VRVPKSIVKDLLKEFGLTMRRATIKNGKRVWIVSDGKAFSSLRAVYGFYYNQKNEKHDGIGFLMDKLRSDNLPESGS
jgi:hypothetical protein